MISNHSGLLQCSIALMGNKPIKIHREKDFEDKNRMVI